MGINDPSISVEFAPFRVEPRFVYRIWGFQDLRPWFDYVAEKEPEAAATSPGHQKGEPIGEVWLTGDECTIATGPLAGKTLGNLFREAPLALLGSQAPSPGSPLLLKVLFAQQKLSVQVHPDDQMAQKYGQPRGKTECWYALAAQPGAQVACGLKPGVTLDKIKDGIHAGTLEESLNLLPVAVGEVIFVAAGTVHAVLPGSILLETQQNCDVTYRMYDYGRPRELHIEKSLEAVKMQTCAGKISAKVLADRTVLVDAEYFCMERLSIAGSRSSASLRGESELNQGLAYLFAAAGTGRVTGTGFAAVNLPARGIIAVPAASPIFVIEDLGGLDLIRISPRWPASTV